MIFTSGTQERDGRTINHDPEPWVAWGVRYPMRLGSTYFEPRPEFVVLDNPILADVRFHASRNGVLPKAVYESWLGYVLGDPDSWSEEVTPEQIDHARRVLTRLANLERGTK